MTHCPACRQAFEPPEFVPWTCPHCRRTVLGRYQDLQWIGGGAMGDVYRATQPDMGGRVVAVKIPKSMDPMLRSRFEREIAASARLEHPNIVRAYDRNEHSGWSYLVMEYVEGKLLSEVVQQEHPLPVGRVARLLAGVARGLSHAASRGIVNRDIKPENIQVAGHDLAKILDYGLARIADLDRDHGHVTHSGTLLGTPNYMAPEQAADPHGVAIAADVYALGCTLFYALAGRPPYLGTNTADVRRQHVTAPRPRLSDYRSDVPAKLDGLVAQMMAIDPAARPHPDEVAQQLEALAAQFRSVPPPTGTGRGGMVDTICPGCGETYHVRAETVGNVMQCPNTLCRRRFTITPAGTAPAAAAGPSPTFKSPPGPARPAVPDVGLTGQRGTIGGTAHAAAPAPEISSISASSKATQPPSAQYETGEFVGEPLVRPEDVSVEPVSNDAAGEDVPIAEAVCENVYPEADFSAPCGIEQLQASVVPPVVPPAGDSAHESSALGRGFHDPPPPDDGSHQHIDPPPVWFAEAIPVDAPPPIAFAHAVPVDLPGPAAEVSQTLRDEECEPLGGDSESIEVGHAVPVSSTDSSPGVAQPWEWPPPIETASAVPATDDDPTGIPPVYTSAVPSVSGASDPGPAAPLFGVVQPAATASKRARQRPARNLRRSERIVRGLVTAGVASVLVLAIVVGYQQYTEYTKTPGQRWADAKKLYDNQSWTVARKEFLRFEKDFPDDPHVAQVPFFVDMCDAQAQTQSLTGDPVRGLELTKQIFKKHRDNPAYHEYSADLYQGLERLVGSFNSRALARLGVRGRQHENKSGLVTIFFQRTWSDQDVPAAEQEIRRAQEAHELLATIGRGRTEDWVPQRTEELRRSIASTSDIVGLAAACKEASELLEPAGRDLAAVQFDEVYQRIDALAQRYAELGASSEFVERRQRFEALEPQRVRRYGLSEGEGNAAPSQPAASAGEFASLAVAWQDGKPQVSLDVDLGPQRQEQVVLGLAHGVLYAFSSQGEFLWARRLGIDSYRLPTRFEASLFAPATLVAISTDDNSLLAIEEATGKVLWKFPAGSDLAAPPTIVHLYDGPNDKVGRVRGLLPTADGEIRCLEMALGRELCRFQVGEPLTIAGTFNQDRKNPLVYFPAASKRVFVIDPRAIDDETRDPCVCVLYTGHAHGSVRSSPVVLDRYLVLPEARSLDEMSLACYVLDRAGRAPLRVLPKKREKIIGWSWFAPDLWPDRMLLVTDAGDVGLFGFNLDNPREAVFRLIESQDLGVPQGDAAVTRSLAVYQDEHSVWTMVGGKLRKLAVNVLEGKLREVWPREGVPAVEGVPLHEAQTDELSETLYVAHVDPRGRQCLLTAVDADTGKRLWQRPLGLWPAADPIPVSGEGVLVVDRCGRTCLVPAQVPRPQADNTAASELVPLEPAAQAMFPDQESEIGLLSGDRDKTYLYYTSEQGVSVRLRPLEEDEGTWREIRFPQPLHGQPAVMGEFLVAACTDGFVYRRPLDGRPLQVANEQPFQWELPSLITPAPAHVAALGESSVLLADGGTRLRVLRLEETDDVQGWGVEAALELSTAVQGPPVVHGGRIYMADAKQRLYVIDAGLQTEAHVELSGRVTAGPVLRAGHVLVVVDNQRLAAVSSQGDGSAVAWETEKGLIRGRIHGLPSVVDETLVVSDDRKLLGLSVQDGRCAWEQRMPTRSFAVCAAAPIGERMVVQPLADGTLLAMRLPEVNSVAARSQADTPRARSSEAQEGQVP